MSLRSRACFSMALLLFASWTLAACTKLPNELATDDRPVRILLVGDPFAAAIRIYAPELAEQLGHEVEIEIVGYDEVYDVTLRNAQDAFSQYDIVSFDVVWIGEYAAKDILMPLDGLIAATPELRVDDYLSGAYQSSRYDNRQLGLPIQPHPELLWYWSEPLANRGLKPPQTTDELLAVAKALTDPEYDRYGICWNAQRGQALGQQMAHFYAAFGQPLLDVNGNPTLDTPAGVAAATFARDLLAASPPDILLMAWDERIRRFGEGSCAMTYGWAARTYLVNNPNRARRDPIGFVGAPHSPNTAPVTPLGTWSLGIPANIGPRQRIAWEALTILALPKTSHELALQGNGGTLRRSLLHDPMLQQRYPAFDTVARLDTANELADWMRPAIPEWYDLAEILGTVYYDMLRGDLTPEEAAARAQREAEHLFLPTGDRP